MCLPVMLACEPGFTEDMNTSYKIVEVRSACKCLPVMLACEPGFTEDMNTSYKIVEVRSACMLLANHAGL